MSWIVDCSVAMAWCFEDEATSRTEALLDRTEAEPVHPMWAQTQRPRSSRPRPAAHEAAREESGW